MPRAIAASREAFVAMVEARIAAPPRVHLTEGAGTTLLMGAAVPEARVAKVVSVFPDNVSRGLATTSGLALVLDPETGVPGGICDGGTLTAIRTGAASGLATDLLARPDAEVGAVLGAGGQAETQLIAMDTVRDLREIRVFAPTAERLESFVARVQSRVTACVVAARSSEAAIDDADIVSCATSSKTPVFDGSRLATGAHVNAVGSFRLDMCELDFRVFERAARIVVDLRESAQHEAGELVAALEAGVTRTRDWIELGDLVREPARGRRSSDDITVFKSVGHAAQDLFAASVAFVEAERLGIGATFDLGGGE